MSYGKTLLTNLFYILILCAFGGLWYVQYHHYAEEIQEKNKAVQVLETEVDALKSTMQEQEITLLQKSRSRCNKEIELYTTQLQTLKNKHDSLVQSNAQTLETLALCKKELKDISSTMTQQNTPPVAEKEQGSQCPSASKVNQFLSEGQWSNPDFNWWFEFAFRPLQENEVVQDPFKVLFDGTYIDCYYYVGKTDTQETIDDIWIVIKGMSPDGEIQINNGWETCVMEGCERKCEYKENNGCYFELQTKQSKS